MKKLLLPIVLLWSFTTYGQARFNYTEAQIRADKDLAKNKFTNETTTQGYPYLQMESDRLFAAYYFDDNHLSWKTIVVPKTDVMLSTIVEFYNKNYVIVSAIKWLQYTPNGILQAELLTDDGVQYFEWTKYEQ